MSDLAIDVVLRTHNRAHLLEGAVESLFAADASGIRVKLLVVDNASSDGTAELLGQLARRFGPQLISLYEPKPGGQHALNCAIMKAEAPVIAFFDDDERVAPQWLQIIAREFADPATIFIAGPCRPLWRRPAPDWLPSGYGGVLGMIDYGPERKRYYRDFGGMLTQGNCALRRWIFAETGPYPATLATAEDRWLNAWLEARQAVGYYCPDFEVSHLIQEERLHPGYFRAWAAREGRDRAVADSMSGLPSLFSYRWYWKHLVRALMILMFHRGSRADRFKARLDIIQARANAAAYVRRKAGGQE